MANAEPGGMLHVEVVYSPAPRQVDRSSVSLPRGSTVADALAASGVLGRHPTLDASAVGRWGRRCGAAELLREGDRIELYRALEVDPKESRRRRQRIQSSRRRSSRAAQR
jgi:putative ubiquitin-RnfH superfamily antitoxin RatB of RatAB toxin-antitoxin module